MVDTPFPKLKLTVNKVEGNCYHGYKIGDELILDDFTHPPQHFCLGLAHALFPVIYALSFGARFPFMDNQRSLLVTCPDGGKLEFKAEIFDGTGKYKTLSPTTACLPAGRRNWSSDSDELWRAESSGRRPVSCKEGKIEKIPKDQNHKGPNPKKMVVEVVKAKGKCAFGYKAGDKWETIGLKCIPNFCGAAFHTAFPALFGLNFGAKFFFMNDPDCIDTVTCPDGGKIVFKVSRVE